MSATPHAPTAPRPAPQPWRELLELLSSMRFAIALLAVICIASVIGTVVQQGQPAVNYVNQFGPFWAQVFGRLGLFSVYSAWWFLLILAFLVISTSLCIARNLPKIAADLRTFKEAVREQSLLAHHHKAEGLLAGEAQGVLDRVAELLRRRGWKLKLDARPHGAMLAARQGGAGKVGYVLAHGAIVLICLGGLADGELMVRAQMWAQGLTPTQGGPDALAAQHRLSLDNPAFRANLSVPEGQRSNTAVIPMPQGMLIQPLPFEVELKKFRVEYYPTGMPRLFASDIVIHDRERGVAQPATVEVNHPAIYRGVAIYQQDFRDGGSQLRMRAWPLDGAVARAAGGQALNFEGQVGSNLALPAPLSGGAPLMLELADLRVINVENLSAASEGGAPAEAGATSGDASGTGATDVRAVDLGSRLAEHLGAGNKAREARHLQNVGPSVTYKLRDASGQAHEFQNYMAPMPIDGQLIFLLGQREDPGAPFRYLRVPADEQGSLEGWVALRHALGDAALRAEAVRRYVLRAAPPGRPDLAAPLSVSAERALALFAGAIQPAPTAADGSAGPPAPGGLQALSDFIERNVPPDEQARAGQVLVRMLDGLLFDLLNVSREAAGRAPLQENEATRAFLTQSVLALSDSFFYAAPAIFTLTGFDHVQASVFQVTRAPGQYVVYAGCALLVAGVFAMLYVRERRLWVWLQPQPDAEGHPATLLRCALSATRQTLDLDREFNELSAELLGPSQGPATGATGSPAGSTAGSSAPPPAGPMETR